MVTFPIIYPKPFKMWQTKAPQLKDTVLLYFYNLKILSKIHLKIFFDNCMSRLTPLIFKFYLLFLLELPSLKKIIFIFRLFLLIVPFVNEPNEDISFLLNPLIHSSNQHILDQFLFSFSFPLGMELSCVAFLLGIFIYVSKVGPYPNLYIFPLHPPPPFQADFLCVRAPAPTSSITHLWFQNPNYYHRRNPNAPRAVPRLLSASSIRVGTCMS